MAAADPFSRLTESLDEEKEHTETAVDHKSTLKVEEDDAGKVEQEDFWKVHEEWKSTVLKENKFTNPVVYDPETCSRSYTQLTATVFYKIQTDDIEGFVLRRYSDFEWLQDLLKARYVGMVIPPLPPKVVGSSQHFLCLRMCALTLFLQKLVSNVYLKNDASVLSFFTENNAEQWTALKKKSSSFQEHRNDGHDRWLQALSHFALPDDSSLVLAQVTRQAEDLSRQLGKLLQGAQSLSTSSQHYTSSVVDFDSKFQDMLISEMISTNADADKEEGVVEEIKSFSYLVQDWKSIASKESAVIDSDLLESLRFEHGLVSQLREVLKRRSEVIKLHDRSSQKQKIHERELSAAEHGKDIETVSKLRRKVAEDEERVKNTFEHALFLTKGLFFSGIRKFNSAKSQRLCDLRKRLCLNFKKFHNEMERMWAGQLEK